MEVVLIFIIWVLSLATFGAGFLVATLLLKPKVAELTTHTIKALTTGQTPEYGGVLRPSAQVLADKKNPSHQEEMDEMRKTIEEIKKRDELI